MVVLSLASYSSELIDMFAAYPEQFSQAEEYINTKDNFLTLEKTLSENGLIEIDLLAADIKLDRRAWELKGKDYKELIILSLLIYMYENTQSTDLMINVDYTTVFWCSSGRVITKRIY